MPASEPQAELGRGGTSSVDGPPLPSGVLVAGPPESFELLPPPELGAGPRADPEPPDADDPAVAPRPCAASSPSEGLEQPGKSQEPAATSDAARRAFTPNT